MYVSLVLFFVFTLFSNCCALSLLTVRSRLPGNSAEAQQMLADAAIDSATWNFFAPFYDDPISVALGELRYLEDYALWQNGQLPTTEQELKRYEPWAASDVDRFFHDYPHLEIFRPVLVFESVRQTHIALVRFGAQTRSSSSRPAQSIRVNIDAGKRLSFETAVKFENEWARWQRRRLDIKAPKWLRVQAGNFSLQPAGGMLMGYYPELTFTDTNTVDNWLYGTVRGWNGLAAAVTTGKRGRLDAYFHYRPSETAIGCEAACASVGPLKLSAGFVGLDAERNTSSQRDTLYTIYSSLSVLKQHVRAELIAATNVFGPACAAVQLGGGYVETTGSVNARAFFLPSMFEAPRSVFVHNAKKILAWPDSMRGDIAGFDIGFEKILLPILIYSFDLAYVFTESSGALEATWKVRGDAAVSYLATYRYLQSPGAAPGRHAFDVSLERMMQRKVSLGMTGALAVVSGTSWRTRMSVDARIDALPSVTFLPSISYSVSNSDNHDISCIWAQRLLLFEKTYGDFKLIFPLWQTGNEGFRAYANSSFLF